MTEALAVVAVVAVFYVACLAWARRQDRIDRDYWHAVRDADRHYLANATKYGPDVLAAAEADVRRAREVDRG